jgi:hypothetical protein
VQLHKLKNGASVIDPDQALDEFQGTASQAHITMIHFSLPHGQSPEVVTAWWDSLIEAQRRELKLALPVELADLNGDSGRGQEGAARAGAARPG